MIPPEHGLSGPQLEAAQRSHVEEKKKQWLEMDAPAHPKARSRARIHLSKEGKRTSSFGKKYKH